MTQNTTLCECKNFMLKLKFGLELYRWWKKYNFMLLSSVFIDEEYMFQVALLVISFELTSQHEILQHEEFQILLSVCRLWYNVLFF